MASREASFTTPLPPVIKAFRPNPFYPISKKRFEANVGKPTPEAKEEAGAKKEPEKASE